MPAGGNMKISPERAISLVPLYLASGILASILIPVLSIKSRLCPLKLDLVEHWLFSQFIQRGIMSSASACSFSCLFIAYVVIASIFVALLRRPLLQAVAAQQRQVEGRASGTGKAFIGFFMLGLFTLTPSLLPHLIPLKGRIDSYFELKSLYMLMFTLCGAVSLFGFAFLHASGIVDDPAE
jgi:hypothetical protein